MAEKWVAIWHPEIEGEALVTETSFRKLREPKGWLLVEDDPDDDGEWPDRPIDLEEDQTDEGVE